MAQDIQSIMQGLDAGYNPQRQAINQQISQLPSQAAAQTAGLQGQQQTAFDNINNQARDKGMGFSGIPMQEQAKYTADNFLPAVAKVQQSQNDSKGALTDALNAVNLHQQTQAYGIQTHQQDLEQQQAQFEAQQAAALKLAQARSGGANDGLGGLFSGGGGDPTAGAGTPAGAPNASPMANYSQRADKGYQFTDHNGQSINASQYAKMTNVPIRTLLSQMAASGDSGAQTALGFMGNDGRADPRKIANPAIANLYKALTGNSIGVYKAPVSGHDQVVNAANSFFNQFSGSSNVQSRLAAARAAGQVR